MEALFTDVYRSRACKYVYESNSVHQDSSDDQVQTSSHPFFANQCNDCQIYLRELDKKYMNGKILEFPTIPLSSTLKLNENTDISNEVSEEMCDIGNTEVKRKRGRPKGSKNKSFITPLETDQGDNNLLEAKEENDENDPMVAADIIVPDERVLVNSDDPDFIYGNEDIALDEESLNVDMISGGMSSMMDMSKISMQKGLRKRITTKRQKALLETKRKRGRPPIKVGPIDCSDCDKILDNVKDYRKHCLEHINSFACNHGDCVKRFKSQKDLDIHLRKHRGEKPYVCSECDKAYAIRQDLRLHIRTQHTGNRPYKCEMCPKAFARAHQLAVHAPVHTGERAHLCSECGNSFSSVSSLIDHRKRRHQNIRNQTCPTCPKNFFTKQELVSHIRTHTGEKPFQCLNCGKCFSRPHHLKRHVAGVHNREKAKPTKMFIRDESVAYDADTVLVHTDEMGETVLIKSYLGDHESGQFVVQPAESTSRNTLVTSQSKENNQSGQFTGAAATSLLQLSQVAGSKVDGGEGGAGADDEEEPIFLPADSVVEIAGHDGEFVLVNVNNEQKLMPISQLLMQTSNQNTVSDPGQAGSNQIHPHQDHSS